MRKLNVKDFLKDTVIILIFCFALQCQTNRKSTLQKNVLFIIVDDLPRSPAGKILKRELKEQYSD